jgi:hypothetical protein
MKAIEGMPKQLQDLNLTVALMQPIVKTVSRVAWVIASALIMIAIGVIFGNGAG